MVRESFQRELEKLQEEVLELGGMVEEAVRAAVAALKARDRNLAREVVAGDARINKKRLEIEEKALELLATQQPMAGDLRVLTAILHIVTDLERMGDHAEGLGKIVLRLGDEPWIKPLIDIPRMSEIALEMLREALRAFLARDAEAAKRIALRDDEVDALHDQVHRELFLLMIENPRNVTQATYLMWASHGLERIADLVTNVCERVIFVATGVMEELNLPRLSGFDTEGGQT